MIIKFNIIIIVMIIFVLGIFIGIVSNRFASYNREAVEDFHSYHFS